VRERPILMQGEMVRATLAELKRMTRRTRGLDIVNASPDAWQLSSCGDLLGKFSATFQQGDEQRTIFCPYGRVGDRLWVRETWCNCWQNEHGIQASVIYRADPHVSNVFGDAPGGYPWKPSIHMPRWAARLHLEITSLGIERVQDISEADALREGVARFEGPVKGVYLFQDYSKAGWGVPVHTARESFETLWDSINGTWKRNEWCWVIGFKRLSQ